MHWVGLRDAWSVFQGTPRGETSPAEIISACGHLLTYCAAQADPSGKHSASSLQIGFLPMRQHCEIWLSFLYSLVFRAMATSVGRATTLHPVHVGGCADAQKVTRRRIRAGDFLRVTREVARQARFIPQRRAYCALQQDDARALVAWSGEPSHAPSRTFNSPSTESSSRPGRQKSVPIRVIRAFFVVRNGIRIRQHAPRHTGYSSP